jgi:DNA-binding beta-propeller fold protein YncE
VRKVWSLIAFLLLILWAPAARQSAAAPSGLNCNAGVARYDVAVPGHPFSVASSVDGQFAFVAIDSSDPTSPNGIGVLRCNAGRYMFSHLVPLEAEPTGMAITRDGKLLVVADDGFVAFVDTAAAINNHQPAIVGYMQDLEGSVEDNDPGSVYVNISPDDRFAFVSDEQNLSITVIDLTKARSGNFTRHDIVGEIPVANAPIALSFSTDGRYLFTTSEVGRKAYHWPVVCKPEGADPKTAVAENPAGAILTIDVAKAEVDPAHSVISRIASDCSPVRLSLSPGGATAWVSNRASNTVTAFSTARLVAGDADARIATVKVGSNPVAIAATSDGHYVLAANTNRFGAGGTTAGTVSVIDAEHSTVVGTIPVGAFPREFSSGPDTTLFLANNRSNTITVFDTSRLPEIINK